MAKKLLDKMTLPPNQAVKEEWRIIPGYPGYEASSMGRIRSTTRTLSDGRRWQGRVLRPRITRLGYERISIALGSTALGYRCTFVHVLVAEAFLGAKPTPDHEIAHRDGAPANNQLENLRWATPKENAEDRERHGRTAHPKGSAHGMAKLTEVDVRQLREMKLAGANVDELASRFGVKRWTIFDALSGRTWGHLPPNGPAGGDTRSRLPYS